MKTLFNFIKKYWYFAIIILLFTFVQTNSELMLPEFMSDVVDTGIQYQGVESTALEAISEDSYNTMLLFMDEQEQSLMNDNYILIDTNDSNYVDQYPLNETEPIYVLNTDDESIVSQIASISIKPLIYTEAITNEELAATLNLDSEQIKAMLLNPEAKASFIATVDQELANFSDDNIASMAKVMVNSEYITLGIDTNTRQMNYIYQMALLMLAFSVIASASSILRAFLASITATRVAYDIRNTVFRKIESFSSYEFSKFSTASLITRTTNDIQQIQMVTYMFFRMMLYAPVMGITAFLKVVQYKSMLWIIGIILLVITLVIVITMTVAMPKFKIIQKLVDKLNLVMRERLSNNLVVRAFNTEDFEADKFDKANKNVTKVNIFVNRLSATLMPIMMFIMNVSMVAIIWFAATQIDIGALEIGDMIAFLQYVMELLFSFMMLSMIFVMIPRAIISANRIQEILDTEVSIVNAKETLTLPEENGEIIFDHVSFKYPNAQDYVLKDISFKTSPGQSIAIIGSTGSGKSTLINMIPRFFDATTGAITINGINIKDLDIKNLRDHIGYIPQSSTLFQGTIESNIKYSDENIDDQRMNYAIDIAQAREFISSKEDGVQEVVAQHAQNFSGGQKQRISIARALCKKANIYLFDDSLSALDFETASKLNTALNNMIRETKATILIVAQRISSIQNCDQIIVLDEGQIAGIGTHDHLIKNCKVYQEIAYSQLSKGEIENGR